MDTLLNANTPLTREASNPLSIPNSPMPHKPNTTPPSGTVDPHINSPHFSPCKRPPPPKLSWRRAGSHRSESVANKVGSLMQELPDLADVDPEPGDPARGTPHTEDVPHVYRVVLTGGPCGGKTTALSTIADYLRSLGTQVFMVPENATIFANGGAGFPVHSSKAQQMCWESSRIICQMQMEDCFIRIARSSGKPTVVLCDRGTMDAAAYMDTQRWSELMEQQGWQTDTLREERYDAVVHLHTTAIGAEDYYTLSNNEARREGLEQAAEVDHKIAAVWRGHPHVEYVDNSTDFPRKIIRVVESICRILGMHAPTSSGFFKVFGIAMDFKDVLPSLCIRFEEFFVQTDFLKNSTPINNHSVRVRRQRDHGSELSLYTCSSRTVLANSKVAIEERAIDAKEYYSLLKQVDTGVAPVRRWRRCFEYQDTYFQLDEYEDDQLLLSVEVPSEDARVALPPWILSFVIAEDVETNLYTTAQRLYRIQKEKEAKMPNGAPSLAATLLNGRPHANGNHKDRPAGSPSRGSAAGTGAPDDAEAEDRQSVSSGGEP